MVASCEIPILVTGPLRCLQLSYSDKGIQILIAVLYLASLVRLIVFNWFQNYYGKSSTVQKSISLCLIMLGLIVFQLGIWDYSLSPNMILAGPHNLNNLLIAALSALPLGLLLNLMTLMAFDFLQHHQTWQISLVVGFLVEGLAVFILHIVGSVRAIFYSFAQNFSNSHQLSLPQHRILLDIEVSILLLFLVQLLCLGTYSQSSLLTRWNHSPERRQVIFSLVCLIGSLTMFGIQTLLNFWEPRGSTMITLRGMAGALGYNFLCQFYLFQFRLVQGGQGVESGRGGRYRSSAIRVVIVDDQSHDTPRVLPHLEINSTQKLSIPIVSPKSMYSSASGDELTIGHRTRPCSIIEMEREPTVSLQDPPLPPLYDRPLPPLPSSLPQSMRNENSISYQPSKCTSLSQNLLFLPTFSSSSISLQSSLALSSFSQASPTSSSSVKKNPIPIPSTPPLPFFKLSNPKTLRHIRAQLSHDLHYPSPPPPHFRPRPSTADDTFSSSSSPPPPPSSFF